MMTENCLGIDHDTCSSQGECRCMCHVLEASSIRVHDALRSLRVLRSMPVPDIAALAATNKKKETHTRDS